MLSFLALGDSYTIGEGVPAESAWPWQLVKALRRKDVLMATPHIIAQTGWTSGELNQALTQAEQAGGLRPPYSLVSLLIGVNNQYRGLPVSAYETEFNQLLARALELAGGLKEHVIVLSIPDWGVTPFAAGRDRAAIAAEIREFNRVNARAAYQQDLTYCNLTQISLLAKNAPILLAEDGLHYSPEMYRRWAELLLPKVWRIVAPDRDFHIPLLYPPEENHA